VIWDLVYHSGINARQLNIKPVCLRPRTSGRRKAVTVEARKVALLGAAGGIGQPLALLLKMNKLITELALYDIANVVGVAADISHCNTPVKVW
jgi:malate dehydrogenase